MITVNFNSKDHLYIQVVRAIINQIASGDLKSGDKLPSRRTLAKQLDVSLNTVVSAYNQLLDEGYIISKERSGYFIDLLSPDMIPSYQDIEAQLPIPPEIPDEHFDYRYDFHYSSRDLSNLNINQFLHSAPKVLEQSIQQKNEKQGVYSVRESIAKYLTQYRGVATHPENVIITGGHWESVAIIDSLLEEPLYGVEDPGYYYKQENSRFLKIPIDKYGFSVADLEKSPAKIAITTPNHQFPTGIIMGLRRRQRLLKWVYEESDRYIIENDYYNEFRLNRNTVPSLMSLDQNERVILMGSFRQSLGSVFRLSYLVLPNHLIERVYQMNIKIPSISLFEQYLISHFLNSDYFSTYINSLRTNYRRKEKKVIEMLKKSQIPIQIHEAGSGLYFVITFEDDIPEESIIKERLEKANIRLESVNQYSTLTQSNSSNSYILGYGGLALAEIEAAIQSLLKIFY